jgi:hypothetical protein
VFDNTKLIAECERIQAWIDSEDQKFPDGSLQRRYFSKLRYAMTLYLDAARLGHHLNPLQKEQRQRLIEINLEAQNAMGEALAMLQETDEPYDRDLFDRVLAWKPKE